MEKYKILLKGDVRGREYRSQKLKNDRISKRALALAEFRNIQEVQEPQLKVATPKKSRLELLKEWKEQKLKKENLQKTQKKPVFVVGKVRYKASGSPSIPLQPIENVLASVRKGVVTRSQAKHSAAKKAETKPPAKKELFKFKHLTKVDGEEYSAVQKHKFALPRTVALLKPKLTIPLSPKITKSARKSIFKDNNSAISRTIIEKMNTMNEEVEIEISKENSNVNLPAPDVKKSVVLNFSPDEGNRNGPKIVAENLNLSTEFQHLLYSPLIEKRRGSSGRRSQKFSVAETVDDEIKRDEEVSQSRIVGFRLFLANETCRLLKLAESWRTFVDGETGLPADVEGEVNAAVGKTKLLTSDKFKQFEGLIAKCEAGDPGVKVDDLQGFQDWVMLEVDDLNLVFTKLQERRDGNWAETALAPIVYSKRPQKTAAIPVKKVQKKTTGASSNLRAHIMAARRKMTVGADEPSESTSAKKLKLNSPERDPVASSATIITSNVTPPHSRAGRSSIRTPREQDLRRSLLIRRCSGLEIMAASSRARSLTPGKSPLRNEQDSVSNALNPANEPTIPIDLPTPSKSILRLNAASTSVKKAVFFAQSINPSYFEPAMDTTSEETPEVVAMVSGDLQDLQLSSKRSKRSSISSTPSRRSVRLAQRNFLATPI